MTIQERELSRLQFLKKVGGGTAAIYVGGSLLAACGGDDEEAEPANGGARKTSRLIIAVPALPTGFDREVNGNAPDARWANNLFETALRSPYVSASDTPAAADAQQVDTRELVAGAFESWQRDANDPRMIEFTVRKSWKSNFGNELTAEDVKWTIERAYGLKGFSIFLFFEGGFGDPKTSSVEVVDKYTVRLTTNAPNLATEQIMTSPFNYFLDSVEAKKHVTDKDPWASEWLQRNAAGWGAYTVKTFKPGEEVVLEARDDYHEGKPQITEVIMREIPESSSRLALLSRGEVDVALGLTAKEYDRLADTDGVQVLDFVGNQKVFIHLNQKRPPLDNKLVRQALNYATPAEEIGASVYSNKGQRTKSPLASIYPDYTDKYGIYSHDLEKARSLLEQAGHGGGFGLELLLAPDVFPELPDVASILQTEWRKIGVELSIKTSPASSFFNTVYGPQHGFQAALDKEPAFVSDPAHTMWQFFNSNSDIDTSNYASAEYDRLTNAALQTADRAERTQLYDQAQKLVMEDAVWVYIWDPAARQAMRDDIRGYAWEIWDGFHWPAITRA